MQISLLGNILDDNLEVAQEPTDKKDSAGKVVLRNVTYLNTIKKAVWSSKDKDTGVQCFELLHKLKDVVDTVDLTIDELSLVKKCIADSEFFPVVKAQITLHLKKEEELQTREEKEIPSEV